MRLIAAQGSRRLATASKPAARTHSAQSGSGASLVLMGAGLPVPDKPTVIVAPPPIPALKLADTAPPILVRHVEVRGYTDPLNDSRRFNQRAITAPLMMRTAAPTASFGSLSCLTVVSLPSSSLIWIS